MKLEIILIAAVILIAAYVTNVFVTLRASQQNLHSLEKEIKEAIQKYLDMVPLLLFKLEDKDKAIFKARDDWFNNWDNLKKHWEIWAEIHKKLVSLTDKDSKEAKQTVLRMKAQDQVIQELVHKYNEKLIKLEQLQEKKVFKIAANFTKIKAQKHQHLAV